MLEKEVEALQRIKRFHEEITASRIKLQPLYVFGAGNEWSNLWHVIERNHLSQNIRVVLFEEAQPILKVTSAGAWVPWDILPVMDPDGKVFRDWLWYKYLDNGQHFAYTRLFELPKDDINTIQRYGNVFTTAPE